MSRDNLVGRQHGEYPHTAQCIVIGPVCGTCLHRGRAGGVRTLLQPARAQCLRLSERFFLHFLCKYLTTFPVHGNNTEPLWLEGRPSSALIPAQGTKHLQAMDTSSACLPNFDHQSAPMLDSSIIEETCNVGLLFCHLSFFLLPAAYKGLRAAGINIPGINDQQNTVQASGA